VQVSRKAWEKVAEDCQVAYLAVHLARARAPPRPRLIWSCAAPAKVCSWPNAALRCCAGQHAALLLL